MRLRLTMCVLLTACTLGVSGCPGDDDSEDPAATPTVSADIQAAVARLTAEARQQMQAATQAQQANGFAGIQRALDQQQQSQQQARQYAQSLQQARNTQALADYYAARTRANQRMTQIIKDEMAQEEADMRRYEQQRQEQQYEDQRAERERLQALYEEQQAEARRQAEEANKYP